MTDETQIGLTVGSYTMHRRTKKQRETTVHKKRISMKEFLALEGGGGFLFVAQTLGSAGGGGGA